MRQYSLKQALELCPIDECPWKWFTPSRQWWRYGWAYGFLLRNLRDATAPVREHRYRVALTAGYDRGVKARHELDSVGTSV
jgi:hypothetical protein